jgi:hypothetical protein
MVRTSSRLPERLAKKLRTRTDKKLIAYAAAAGAGILALTQLGSAEIVFTPAHQTIAPGTTIDIDLNHDGITDFTIENHAITSVKPGSFDEDLIVAAGAQPSNLMLGSLGSLVGGPQTADALPMNFKVSSNAGSLVSGGVMFECLEGPTSGTAGPWKNVQRQFLGLKFTINGETHFGWARFSLQALSGCKNHTLLSGYAYETQPNTPINAGQTQEGPKVSGAPITLGRLAQGAHISKQH